jgi:hypothetical protein
MKTVALTVMFGLSTLLSGCVAYDPYYQSQPVYVQPRPIYVQPRPIYVQPRPVYIQPRCTWVAQYDRYSRTYRNVRICR